MSKPPFAWDQRVQIIAEIGNNHEGSVEVAEEMVERAAVAGVDAVKFQIFRPEHYISRSDKARYQRLCEFALSPDEFTRLSIRARKLGLLFFATPFDLDSCVPTRARQHPCLTAISSTP